MQQLRIIVSQTHPMGDARRYRWHFASISGNFHEKRKDF